MTGWRIVSHLKLMAQLPWPTDICPRLQGTKESSFTVIFPQGWGEEIRQESPPKMIEYQISHVRIWPLSFDITSTVSSIIVTQKRVNSAGDAPSVTFPKRNPHVHSNQGEFLALNICKLFMTARQCKSVSKVAAQKKKHQQHQPKMMSRSGWMNICSNNSHEFVFSSFTNSNLSLPCPLTDN